MTRISVIFKDYTEGVAVRRLLNTTNVEAHLL